MITEQELDESIIEALRFVKTAKAMRERLKNDELAAMVGTKQSGAVRRASLDLTRKLADLRRSR